MTNNKNNIFIINIMFIDNADDENPLFELIESGDVEEFKSEIDNDNINQVNEIGESPLMYACESGELEMVNILLNSGADKNILSDDRETALMIAISDDEEEIVNSLLNVGGNVDLDVHDDDGNTAIMIAAINGDINVVGKLIQKGASLTLVNNDNLNISQIVQEQIHKYNEILCELDETPLVDTPKIISVSRVSDGYIDIKGRIY